MKSSKKVPQYCIRIDFIPSKWTRDELVYLIAQAPQKPVQWGQPPGSSGNSCVLEYEQDALKCYFFFQAVRVYGKMLKITLRERMAIKDGVKFENNGTALPRGVQLNVPRRSTTVEKLGSHELQKTVVSGRSSTGSSSGASEPKGMERKRAERRKKSRRIGNQDLGSIIDQELVPFLLKVQGPSDRNKSTGDTAMELSGQMATLAMRLLNGCL